MALHSFAKGSSRASACGLCIVSVDFGADNPPRTLVGEDIAVSTEQVDCKACRRVLGLGPLPLPGDALWRLNRVREAIAGLKLWRDTLRSAGAKKAAAYVGRALKSAEGAERHTVRLLNQSRSE